MCTNQLHTLIQSSFAFVSIQYLHNNSPFSLSVGLREREKKKKKKKNLFNRTHHSLQIFLVLIENRRLRHFGWASEIPKLKLFPSKGDEITIFLGDFSDTRKLILKASSQASQRRHFCSDGLQAEGADTISGPVCWVDLVCHVTRSPWKQSHRP
uniref:Uncharacterized protein n=1 Tax=Nelumbo nucifera TaxID=4432 RepID=A0A822XMK0_NELNU|nr:TPA_asm: hypothetical protein HUJ06_020211 [Nelumbo nucifera]